VLAPFPFRFPKAPLGQGSSPTKASHHLPVTLPRLIIRVQRTNDGLLVYPLHTYEIVIIDKKTLLAGLFAVGHIATLAKDGRIENKRYCRYVPIWYHLWCEMARDEQAMRFDVNYSFTEKWVRWMI
jgi:hypothetical protein